LLQRKLLHNLKIADQTRCDRRSYRRFTSMYENNINFYFKFQWRLSAPNG